MGLRPRLVLALVFTSAVTLGVAALALLSPLQARLRDQAEQNVRAAALTARPSFEEELRRSGGQPSIELRDLALDLASRTGSRVIVTGTVPTQPYLYDTAVAGTPINPTDILNTWTEERTTVRSGPDGTRVSVVLNVGERRDHVLSLRTTAEDAAAIVAEVRDAFLTAAAVGLGVAVLLGLALVTTLLRRLERLRAAARRITVEGPGAPQPVDRGGDEVGDLARTLATMQTGLLRQEAARRAFVATASHELRTPLTSLGGTLELLSEDLADGRVDLSDAQEQIALAQGEVGRLTHLASDLLDLSRLDAETPLRSEPVELGELCRAVSAEFASRARDAGVEVQVVPPVAPCWGRGDPTAVARIVRILLDNALRFAPAGSTVRLVPAYHGEEATVAVSDRGPGVPADERERIFERFQRGSATGGEGGFGLGLAIGRELAQRQGGRLALASADGGPGARFVLSLPPEAPGGA